MVQLRKPKNGDGLFLCRLELTDDYKNPSNWDAAAAAIFEQHATFLDNLGKEGTLVFAGRTVLNPGDRNLFDIAIIRAPNLEAAQQIMSKDPAVVNNIQQSNLLPFSMKVRHFKNLEP